MICFKLSVWLFLLLLALNCKTTSELLLSRTCLLRICTGNFDLTAPTTLQGSTLDFLQEEADVVNGLAGLMPPAVGFFYCTLSDYQKYSRAIKCNCSFRNNTLCRVTYIDFSDQFLYGRIPEDIGNLSSLTTLDLSGNELYGPIPESFGHLTQLSYLDLCDNKLEGVVPSFLGQIKSLESLYLCSNRLNGSIPSELGTLPSLISLNIRSNSLWGSIPKELCRISSLVQLSLLDNHLEGQLPQQLGDLSNLRELYLMNNNFSGDLPLSIGKLSHLQAFNVQGNNFTGTINSIGDLKDLQILSLMGNNFQGPFPSKLSASLTYLAITDLAGGGTGYPFPEIQNMTLLRTLILRNCSLTGSIPDLIWNLTNLSYLDLSFNSLTGGIPVGVDTQLRRIFLRRNKLNGSLPEWLVNSSYTYVDVSENLFTNVNPSTDTKSPNVNLFSCCSSISDMDKKWQEAEYFCANNNLKYDHLYINCGGNATSINGSYYEADLQPNGGSTFFLSDNKAWAYSSMGTFLYADDDQYIVNKTCNISIADAPLYTEARVSLISLKYFGFCLRNDEYTVRLHFAEIGWDATTHSGIKSNRVFDVEIQGTKWLRDFNIEEAAGARNKDITMEYNVSVNKSRLEIHLYWSGKGSITFPIKYYGPLISAISVFPVPRKHHKFSSGAIAGVVGCSVLILGLIIALFWMLGWLGGKKPKHDGVELYPGGKYNSQQIMAATGYFHTKNKIGKSGGTVYKGILPDGFEIAVKQLSPMSKQKAQGIITEIGTIYALEHPNLARPLGCYPGKNQILLVYKYMENISLQHALLDLEEDKIMLNWQTRVKICLGMAKGLAFLHEESNLEIIHSNIKPSNILLDKEFNVTISDFNYSELHDAQLTDVQHDEHRATCGTMPRAKITGYMAPEQIQGLPLTPKVDVYSFGIVVLEIISGLGIVTFKPRGESIYLLNMAYQYQKENNLMALVDSRVIKECKPNEASRILDLAMKCVSPSFALRPLMSQAVEVLEGIKLKTRLTNVPPPLHTFSPSPQSGSSSQEGSSKIISPATSKEIDEDSSISAN